MENESYIVYADVLLLVNFILDFLCLYVTGAICTVRMKIWRISLSALTGSLYSLVSVYLSAQMNPVLQFILCAAVEALMIFIGFGKSPVRKTVSRCLILFLTSVFSGGLLTAVLYISGRYYIYNGGVYAEISPLVLAVLAVLSVGIAYVYGVICRKRTESASVDCEFTADEKTYKVVLLADTGCSLFDPITGLPAIIVSERVFGNVVPSTNRMIPASTAGGKKIFPAFRPEKITVNGKEVTAVVALDSENEFFGGRDGVIGCSFI